MPRKGPGARLDQSATGEQDLLRLDGCTTSISNSLLGKTLVELGSITQVGTLHCDIDVTGMADVEVHVRASAVTGTVTPSCFTTYADGATSKTALTDSGAGDFVANVARTFSISGLKGVKNVRFQFVIGAGEAITFDRAEFNGR